MKVSIVLPSINPHTWPSILNQIQTAVGDYDFELVCCGPSPCGELGPDTKNFKYIEDFGCPSRSFQKGVKYSSGDYIAFIPDDCTLDEGAFEEALDLSLIHI